MRTLGCGWSVVSAARNQRVAWMHPTSGVELSMQEIGLIGLFSGNSGFRGFIVEV
jgi:hypothetical protein